MPDSMKQKLTAARIHWRWIKAAGGLAIGFSALAALALISFYSDRLLVLSDGMRMAWLITLTAWPIIGALLFIVIPVRRKIPDEAVAQMVEIKYPALRERLLTTIELAHDGPSGASIPMVTQLAGETEEAIGPLNFIRAIPTGSLRRPAIAAFITGLLLCGHVLLAPEAMATWANRILHPHEDIPIYARTQVWVWPGNKVLPRGEDITLGVKLGGRLSDTAILRYRYDGGKWNDVKLTTPQTVGNTTGEFRKFSYKLSDIQQSIEYYAIANDGHANPRNIRVEDRPVLLSLKMLLNYPAYTGKKSQTVLVNSGNIVAPVGTHVSISATANKPLQLATFVENGAVRGPWPVNNDKVRGELTVMRDETYTLRLRDKNGFNALTPPQYTVRAQPDMPPSVQIVKPAADLERVPDGVVNIKVTASDDYGVSGLGIKWRTGKNGSVFSLPGANGLKAAGSQGPWYLHTLPLKAGDVITYQAQARDNDTVSGPHTTLSLQYHIRIISRQEMHERLESEKEQQEMALRELIKHQVEAQQQLAKGQKAPERNEQLNQAHNAQRNVSQEAQELARQMQQTSDAMRDNNMAIPTEQQRRDNAAAQLNSLAQRQMPAAADTIQRAQQQNASSRSQNLNSAQQQEQAIKKELDRIASDTSKGPDISQLAARAEDLAREQQQLADNSALNAAKSENKPTAQMTPQERADLNNNSASQQNLKEKTQELMQDLQNAVRNAQEHGNPNTPALQTAAKEAQQNNPTKSQSAAQKDLQAARQEEASQHQNQAATDLQNIARSLDDANGTAKSDMARKADQMSQMANKLDQMAAQQENLANQSKGNPDANTSRNMAAQQKVLEKQAQNASAQMNDAPNAQEHVDNAAANMSKAAEQMERPAPLSATQPASDAASQLRKAADSARYAAEKLREAQKAREAQNAVEAMAKEQRSLENQTRKLDTERTPKLTQEQQKTQSGLQQNQSKLSEKSGQQRDKMPSESFKWALDQARERMNNASNNLWQQNTGADTQRHQENAAQTLEHIARALGQKADAAKQQAESGGQQTQSNDQMAEAAGDLQLAREMQEQIHKETASVDERRNTNPDKKLSSEQTREVNRLQEAQRETERITRRTSEKLNSNPDINEKVKRAADEMEDVRGNLQKQQTDDKTQGQQKHIVSLLDKAISQTQEAMRQQRQQMMASRNPQNQQQNTLKPQTQPSQKSMVPITHAQTGAFANVQYSGRGFTGLDPRGSAAMREGRNERVPAEYRDLVNQYYKALSEGGR